MTPLRWRGVAALMAAMLMTPSSNQAAPVKGAEVTLLSVNANIRLNQAAEDRSLQLFTGASIAPFDRIEVPAGSQSWADLVALPGDSMKVRLAGHRRRETIWQLPCRVAGAGFISWSTGSQPGACAPPGLVVQSARGGGRASLGVPGYQETWIAALGGGLSMPASSPATLAFRPEDAFASCSASDPSGRVTTSETSAGGIFKSLIDIIAAGGGKPGALCSKALQSCDSAAGMAGTCGVVSQVSPGDWRTGAVAVQQCGTQLRQLSTMDALASLLNGSSSSCTVNVLGRGDALLQPQGGQRTSIAFESRDRGAVVSVIEGSVQISAKNSPGWLTLNAGETYDVGSGTKQPTRAWLQGSASELCRSDEDGDDRVERIRPAQQLTVVLTSRNQRSLDDVAATWQMTCQSRYRTDRY